MHRDVIGSINAEGEIEIKISKWFYLEGAHLFIFFVMLEFLFNIFSNRVPIQITWKLNN